MQPPLRPGRIYAALEKLAHLLEVRYPTDCPYVPGILTFGLVENTAIASSVTAAVVLWEKDYKLYNPKNSNVFTPYTQMIWRHTTEVGCAIATCAPGALDPKNVRTISPPFVRRHGLQVPNRKSLSLRASITHPATFLAYPPAKRTNSHIFPFFLPSEMSKSHRETKGSAFCRTCIPLLSERMPFLSGCFQVYLRLFFQVQNHFTIPVVCLLHLRSYIETRTCSFFFLSSLDTRCNCIKKSRVLSFTRLCATDAFRWNYSSLHVLANDPKRFHQGSIHGSTTIHSPKDLCRVPLNELVRHVQLTAETARKEAFCFGGDERI